MDFNFSLFLEVGKLALSKKRLGFKNMTKRLGDYKSANEQRYEYYGDPLAQDAQHGAMRRSKSSDKPTDLNLKFKGLIGTKHDDVKAKNLSEKKVLNNYGSEMKISKKLKHHLRESVGKNVLDTKILRNNRGMFESLIYQLLISINKKCV